MVFAVGTFHAAADVDVCQALQRNAVEEIGDLEAEVVGVGVDVGCVEEKQRIGLLKNGREKHRFGKVGIVPGKQSRDVFDGEGNREHLLGGTNIFDNDVQRFAGSGQRQQVARFNAAATDEGEVFGHKGEWNNFARSSRRRSAARSRSLRRNRERRRCRGG